MKELIIGVKEHISCFTQTFKACSFPCLHIADIHKAVGVGNAFISLFPQFIHKVHILNIINDEILALDTSDIGIPLGSLILPEFFSGKGPAIPVHILSIRNSDAAFESKFSQAGINQTLHQLTMLVSVDVSVLVMGQTAGFTVTTEVVVAETVIVGDVPSTYLQTGGYYGSQREN